MTNGLLISKTRVKKFLKTQDLRVSEDFYEAFNQELLAYLIKIAKRAKGNRRSTVQANDV